MILCLLFGHKWNEKESEIEPGAYLMYRECQRCGETTPAHWSGPATRY